MQSATRKSRSAGTFRVRYLTSTGGTQLYWIFVPLQKVPQSCDCARNNVVPLLIIQYVLLDGTAKLGAQAWQGDDRVGQLLAAGTPTRRWAQDIFLISLMIQINGSPPAVRSTAHVFSTHENTKTSKCVCTHILSKCYVNTAINIARVFHTQH